MSPSSAVGLRAFPPHCFGRRVHGFAFSKRGPGFGASAAVAASHSGSDTIRTNWSPCLASTRRADREIAGKPLTSPST